MSLTVINTRNRPRKEVLSSGSAIDAALALNDACAILEGICDEFPELRNNQRVRVVLDRAIDLAYNAATILERLSIVPIDTATETSNQIIGESLLDKRPVLPDTIKSYFVGKKIDPHKLYALAQRVGPWECGDAVCWQCPFASSNEVKQHRECLDFYLVERAKKIVLDELATGLPYNRDELLAMHRRDLLALCRILGINRFKLKDRRNKALIEHIVGAQSARDWEPQDGKTRPVSTDHVSDSTEQQTVQQGS